MKHIKSLFVLAILAIGLKLNAQIGYQVSLLNSATGEPRASETVSVDVEISNSEGTIICTETKSATTNEFGVLSLQIGNAKTFQNVDWNKLPLYVSATVDGIMIGKSQILNVPVAEAAKTLIGSDLDVICRSWTTPSGHTLILSRNYTYNLTTGDGGYSGKWKAEGNRIVLFKRNTTESGKTYYWYDELIYYNGNLYMKEELFQ